MPKQNKTDWEEKFAEQREEIIEKIKVIMDRQEIANGFQPRGYASEEQEKEIYFDGFDNRGDMMKIDLLNLIKNI